MAPPRRSHPAPPLYFPGNVTRINAAQLGGALTLSFTQLTDQIANAQVPVGAVTQHQAALAIAFSQLTGLPTTLAGYGIADAYTRAEVDAAFAPLVHTHAFSDITALPTTLAGYGIADAYTSAAVDTLLAAKAPLVSPALTGTPTAPTAAGGTNTTQLATTAFVVSAVAALPGSPVSSVFGRTGAVAAATGDYTFAQIASPPTTLAGYGITDAYTSATVDTLLAAKAPLASPALTGTPTAPTAAGGTNTTQIATTAFVAAALPSVPVASVFGRTGAVVAAANDYTFAQLASTPTTLSGYGITDAAPLASPALTGTPTSPTATAGTNTTQIATTAFVTAAVAAGGGGPGTGTAGKLPKWATSSTLGDSILSESAATLTLSGPSANNAVINVSASGAGASAFLLLTQAGTAARQWFLYNEQTDGSLRVYDSTAGAPRWIWNTSGHLLTGTDNAYDIGTSTTNRPRDVYIAGSYRGGSYKDSGGNQVVANRQPSIANAAANITSVQTQLNLVLLALRNHGLITT